MPKNTFVAGEVLTAAEMNSVADQTVMTFAGSAARGSAIPTPTAGMMSFLADSSAVQVYDGVDWTEISGGSGNVADDAIQPNFNTISNNYTFEDGYNGVSAGPITIASGATVTVGTASSWSVV